ncbi:retropepsin-like aspartic protease family protein [Thalassococcus lentus]|uniref:TIGR02281 family clan AA aspartic protease n=1 Tax=Thalassococcus lentus TaxID=1210524 RepID=A0ABT4XRX6_9RHOB|nr:TIGR02281 family clan AA aspartic protease [Thalassococcus lentus]MDA7424691.1 TIGR02281 family clan AA aspartic protease [Thalassococcus lentus]
MDSFEVGNLIYLVLLASVLGFWFFVQNRDSLSTKVKQAAAWGFIILGTIAVVGLWEDISRTVTQRQVAFVEDGRIELPRNPDGHYYATVDLNGAPVRFVVDTGATSVVLTRQDAERAGLDEASLVFFSEAMTANGIVRTAPVTLKEVGFGPFTDQGVRAYVNEGRMDQSLLGMSYLQRFDRIEISGDRLVLER